MNFSLASDPNQEVTFVARWIVPIVSPPIHNGFIVVRGDRIVKVGRCNPSGKDQAAKTHATPTQVANFVDLGDVALMPGLVNAHTHLEFSDLTEPIGTPGAELADWIGEVIRHRGQTEPSTDTIAAGLAESAKAGTVLIGEISTTPFQWDPNTNCDSPNIDIVAFAETLGLTEARSQNKLALAAEHLSRFGVAAGLSPHAPYSTPPDVIESCINMARQTGALVAMHVAESIAERELLTQGTGPFADNLRALGLPVDATFPWMHHDPVFALVEMLSRSPKALLIHCNDLRDHEIDAVANHPNLSVVYCPRTHHFFRHATHRFGEMLSRGINVALGTDSRASNPDLNLWREARHLLNHRQDVSPHRILEMATINGAKALRCGQDLGSLQANRLARLVSVPTNANDIDSLYGQLAASDAVPVSLD